MTFAIPRVREGNFYPQALEKVVRSERSLLLSLAEMYVQGVSTRDVAAITEQSYAAQGSVRCKSAGQPGCFMKSWKFGVTYRWEMSPN